jgi:hypothetical protein
MKSYELPGCDTISAKLIQRRGNTLISDKQTYDVSSILNIKESPEQ